MNACEPEIVSKRRRNPRIGVTWAVLLMAVAAGAAETGAPAVPGRAAEKGAPAAASASGRPRLIVFVSVDQMHADYLTRFASLYQGGLRRINNEASVFSNAYYRHANSETGPGHAVLLSGRHAPETGIVSNEWYDRVARRMTNVVDDPASRALPGPGRGASPAHFVGSTIGDLLKKASPASRVVGVSMKDRAAVLMAGPRADAAYWFESGSGGFGSSTYYMRALPPWLQAWNAAGHVSGLAGRAWTRILPDEAEYLRLAGPDDVHGEWDNVRTAFPHVISRTAGSGEFYDDLRRTPFIDELILDVALEAMRAHDLGTDEASDILAVGFSATDVIGHTFGPDSQEIMDQMLRLDRTLGKLIDAAEARAGRGKVLLVLSADHGSMPLVEVLRARGLDAKRVKPDAIEGPVRRALEARFPGSGDLIAAFDPPSVWLDPPALVRLGLKHAEVERVVREALLATGFVQRVYTQAQLLGDPPAGDPDFALVRNSFFEARSPDVIATLKPYIYVDNRPGGTGHGTVHPYDRHVPVALMGPGIRAGHHDAACGPEDIAPTLATILGLEYPVEDGQRVLSEALVR
jgi:predicted AlkP superfamily pyrophosphatase or phosphodiesterase